MVEAEYCRNTSKNTVKFDLGATTSARHGAATYTKRPLSHTHKFIIHFGVVAARSRLAISTNYRVGSVEFTLLKFLVEVVAVDIGGAALFQCWKEREFRKQGERS